MENAIKNWSPHLKVAFVGASALGAIFPSAVLAAEDAQAENSPVHDDGLVQQNGNADIVVTAQRRSQRLQDVPMTVTALSLEDTERLSINEPRDIQLVTPGLTFPADNGTINPYIRGRGTNFSGPGLEGSVAVYVDEVYLQTQFGTGGLVDVSQIQVLKGPQGTLYGRNATGGALIISTNDPIFELEGHVSLGIGNLGMWQGEAVINVPLSDTLAVRFAGAFDHRDGFIDNIIDGGTTGRSRRVQSRAKVLWEPTPEFSVLLQGEYQRSDADYLRNQLVDGTNTPTGLGFFETFRSPRVPQSQGGENNTEIWGASIRLNYEGDNFEITNVLAYRDTDLRLCSDNETIYATSFDFCAQLPASVQAAGVTQVPNPLVPSAPNTIPSAFDHTFFTETRLTTSLDGPINFLFGGNYQRTRARFATVLTGSTFGQLLPVSDNMNRIENWGIYGEGDLEITNALRFTAGARFSRDSKSIQIYNNVDAAVAFGIPLAFFPPSVFQEASYNSFTPRFTLAYDAGDANLYASYSAGFKSGGFNALTFFPQIPLEPERIDSFEIGSKFRLLGNTLSIDLAAFYSKSRDIQVAAVDTAVGGVIQQNAATAVAKGIEASILYRPNDSLTLRGGASYLDSHFTSFANASVFDVVYSPFFQDNILSGTIEDLNGFPTTLSPKWTFNASVSYDIPLSGGWGANITLSGRHTSSYDFQAGAGGPQRYARQRSFTVANLTGDIVPPGDTFGLSWYVNNLFDTHYYDQVQANSQVGSTAQGGGVYGSPALPRTYGVRLRVNF